MHHPLKFEANFHGQSIGLLVVVGGRGLEPETVYYGDETIVSFFLMIACFRFETEFHFEYTSYYRKYLMVN